MGTPTEVCIECGHTRYVHISGGGCDVATNYYLPDCPCSGFQEKE